MNVLVVNSGSASLKLELVETGASMPTRILARARIENMGSEAVCELWLEGSPPLRERRTIPDSRAALKVFTDWLHANGSANVDAVGHRFVHGGPDFRSTTVIDGDVVDRLGRLGEFAPIHNPPAIEAIRATIEKWGGDMPMTAVFDTTFHQSIPPHASEYPLPRDLSRALSIRRYGFHGLAHESMLRRYSALTGNSPKASTLVTLQLGGGCSAAAIRIGRSVDTSMGFTPLEGLMMGTRAGDVDPGVLTYLARNQNMPPEQLARMLNEESGLLGISGISSDIRELIAKSSTDPRAASAIEMFCYRVRKYIGAYLAVLGGADAVIFGGGIGENQPSIRTRSCAGMEWCGLSLDPGENRATTDRDARISRPESKIEAWVIRVDESSIIAEETVNALAARFVASH